MNAISRPTHIAQNTAHTERHLRMCRLVAELEMELAEVAADRARSEATSLMRCNSEERARPDAAIAFSHMSHAGCQATALEAQILGGTTENHQSLALSPDSRRREIRAAIANATHDAVLRLEMNEFLDRALAADPGRLIPLQTILETIAEEYDLDPEDLDHALTLEPFSIDPVAND